MNALNKLVLDGVANYQSQIFALNPKMSYVGERNEGGGRILEIGRRNVAISV